MAGWAMPVAVRTELGPWAMVAERGRLRMASVSARKSSQVRGKARSQGSAMPTRCTPWPGGGRSLITGLVKLMRRVEGVTYPGRKEQFWVSSVTYWSSIFLIGNGFLAASHTDVQRCSANGDI